MVLVNPPCHNFGKNIKFSIVLSGLLGGQFVRGGQLGGLHATYFDLQIISATD
jgi:hypothetical protein